MAVHETASPHAMGFNDWLKLLDEDPETRHMVDEVLGEDGAYRWRHGQRYSIRLGRWVKGLRAVMEDVKGGGHGE